MTRIAFLKKVLQIVSVRGRAYPAEDSPGDQRELLNQRLFAFTKRALCLYSDEITIDLAAGTATYAMMTAFELSSDAVPMLEIESFVVNSCEMYNLTIEELRALAPTYKTDSASVPTCYSVIPGASGGDPLLRMYPTPVANHADCPVSGYWGHPQISTAYSADSTAISIPSDHIETAACYCAVGFMYPNAAAGNDIQLMANISQAAARSMLDLTQEAEETLKGLRQRGNVLGATRSRSYGLC